MEKNKGAESGLNKSRSRRQARGPRLFWARARWPALPCYTAHAACRFPLSPSERQTGTCWHRGEATVNSTHHPLPWQRPSPLTKLQPGTWEASSPGGLLSRRPPPHTKHCKDLGKTLIIVCNGSRTKAHPTPTPKSSCLRKDTLLKKRITASSSKYLRTGPLPSRLWGRGGAFPG